MKPLEKYLKECIKKGIYEGSGTDLDDTIYRYLIKIPEFKRLPMDKQGAITMKVFRMITK